MEVCITTPCPPPPADVISPAFHHHFVIPMREVTRTPHHLLLEVSDVNLHHYFTKDTLNYVFFMSTKLQLNYMGYLLTSFQVRGQEVLT